VSSREDASSPLIPSLVEGKIDAAEADSSLHQRRVAEGRSFRDPRQHLHPATITQ
jgi:hypothetical protein